MKTITNKEYNKIHSDYRGKWTNESEPQYVGKRTMMQMGSSGGVELLVEGFHFNIVGF